MRLTVKISYSPKHALLFGLLTLGLAACGIGGPGENNNNNLTRPTAALTAPCPTMAGATTTTPRR